MKPKLLYVGMEYDYGDKARGLSFEHRNFYYSSKSYCEKQNWDFVHYDFMERGLALGLDLMTQELYELAKKEKPTYLFAVLFDFHRDPRHEVFKHISSLGTITIHWFCDDHWRFEKYSSVVAPHFDFLCTTANSALPKYEKLGMSPKVIKTQWACNHELYIPYDIEKDVDISFVGQPHGNRVEVLSKLLKGGLKLEVFGFGWENRPRIPFHQMVRLFSRSKINLNLSNSSTLIGQQIKGRNFEIPGTRSFQLTSGAENLTEYYKDGKEIVIFRSVEELVEKAKYYLKNEDERNTIAINGYKRTTEEHTWHHRYDKIFSSINVERHCSVTAEGKTNRFVSVIIPCYKQAHFLPEAVASVVNQTFTDWECIIVNDGSPDNTSEVAKQLIGKYSDKQIMLVEKENGGLSDARNVGIKNSTGKYILPLDADDLIHPEKLKKSISLLETHPEIAIAYTDVVHFGKIYYKIIQEREYDFKLLCFQNHLNYCSLYRREVWEAVGGYNPNMTLGYEDWDFWISCGEKGYYGKRIPEPLFMYRVKESSMYTKALEHHGELMARIILNHPKLYNNKQDNIKSKPSAQKQFNLLPNVEMAVYFPKQIHFLMNDKCNAKCIMCGGDYYNSTSGKTITLEKFKIMAANLKLEHTQGIVLAGAGDPLLNKDLFSIIQYVRREYHHINISITTNGIALLNNISKQLLENNIASINISINSATRMTYRRIMQVDCFDKICKNIKTLVQMRNLMGKNIQIQFSSAINKLNIEELPLLVELGKDIGIDSINIMYCRFYPERIRHGNIDKQENRLNNNDSLFYYQELSDYMVEQAKAIAQKNNIRFSHEPLFKENASPRPCIWPNTEIMVGFDGEIYPCGGAEVHFKEKVEQGIYNFGNALTQLIDSFWNNEHYRALRISSKQGETCLIPECRYCANIVIPNDIKFHIMQWDNDNDKCETLPEEKLKVPVISTLNTKLPLVSVIVPTYNRPDTLVETLRSIQRQTYQNYEIIVVNDAGMDVENVVPLLTRNGNITYIKHSKNKGLAAARNTGIKAAKGKYIAYLDDDDIFYEDHVETLVNFLENSDYKVAYTDAYRAHQEKENGQFITKKKDVPYSFDFDYDRILTGNFIPVLCIMHEKACIERVGMFDETLRSHEDWDLWMRMSREFQFAHIKKITCEFSWRLDGSTMTVGKKEEMDYTRNAVLQRGIKLYHEEQKQIKALLNKAEDLFQKEAYNEAIDAYKKVIETSTYPNQQLQPEDVSRLFDAYYNLALSYINTEKSDDAIAAFQKASELNSNDATIYNNLGVLYFREKLHDDAKHCFEKALAIDAQYKEAQQNLEKVSTFSPDREKSFRGAGI